MKRLPSNSCWHRCMRGLLLFVSIILLNNTVAHTQCCPPDVDALDITKTAYQFEGTLDINASQLSNADFCLPYADTLPQPEGARYLHLIPFQISTNDVIVVHTPTDSTASINDSLFLSLYRGQVDYDMLCQNLVAVSNLSPAENSAVRLAASLKSNEVYTLLVTTTTAMTTGDFDIQVTTNQDVTEVFTEELTIVTNPDWTVDTIVSTTNFPTAPFTFSVPLNCEDDGLISSTGLELTGDPSQQPGCGTIENLTYQEEINQFQDCGSTFVKRTFTFNGPNGATASCIQRIILRPLSGKLQQDIWLPPANIAVDCGFPCIPDTNDYPRPETTGAPFILTVSGARSLYGEDLCNLSATIYEDSAPIQASETRYSFIRTWVIVDWCHPQDLRMFEQRIQVGTALSPTTMTSQIDTEHGEGIANVLVEFTASGVTDTVYTDASGNYGIPPGFEIDSTLTIRPEKDYDHQNGISTFDMVLISKHILGVSPLSSPYEMIAADVNNSGSISILDLLQIRKLILGISSEFPNNSSWRFVDAGFVFDDPSNPWAGGDTTDTPPPLWPRDFIGIKIGDIDGSADPSSLQPSDNVVVRDGTPFYLHAAARQLQAGQSYDLPIYAHNLPDIDGFQATLQASAAVELLGVKGGLMSTDHFGPVQPNGTMAMSWVAPQELPEGKQPLFTLKLKAKAPTALEEAVHISATLLQPEAYGKDGRWRAVVFRFDTPPATSDVPQLRDNYPNPFRESTQVDFYLPTDRPAQLSVHNAVGQLLYTVEIAGNAGWNTVQLHRSLPDAATGLLHYTLEVGEQRLTKRMLRLW